MQNFRNLEVWRRSHQLVLSLYRLTDGYPRDARFLNLAEASLAEASRRLNSLRTKVERERS